MFRDKYRTDMENVSPSPESIMIAKGKMLEAGTKKPRRAYLRPIIAAATCLCLIAGTFTFIILSRNQNNKKYNGLENPYVTEPDITNQVLAEDATLRNSGDYDNIYGKIKSIAGNSNYSVREDTLAVADTTNAKMSSNSSLSYSPTVGSTQNYSDTNNQVEGVQEADIIKTDGKYIYACGNTNQYYNYYGTNSSQDSADTKGKVYILSADNGKISLTSKITYRTEYNNTHYALREMLLYDDTLVLIKDGNKYYVPDSSETSGGNKYYYPTYNTQTTSVEIYDISDREKPVFENELYQSGSYSSSRMIGKYLYIITNYYVNNPDKSKPETYIPHCSSYNEDFLIPASCIFVPENITASQYMVLTGINVTKPDNHISSTATLGFSGTVYSSQDNIYIASHFYPSYTAKSSASSDSNTDSSDNKTVKTTDSTDIYRFSVDDGVVKLSASARISGNLINQFAMDEYKDTFRVAVTVNETSYNYIKSDGDEFMAASNSARFNNLYILDNDLKITGSVTNMAQNENIRSVRFDGDIGYVVTFRQTDPLFAIDLSDKANPKVLSALKIPGFSTYMHPYGDGLLFGIGMDATDNGRTQGIKMSMFDISDKTNVTEKAVLKLGNNNYYSEALYNHKAILVDAEKNIIGFPVNNYNGYNNSSYSFYKYENNEFKEIGSISFGTKFNYSGLRGLYIGNFVYVFSQNQFINSYDINSLSQVDSFNFN